MWNSGNGKGLMCVYRDPLGRKNGSDVRVQIGNWHIHNTIYAVNAGKRMGWGDSNVCEHQSVGD